MQSKIPSASVAESQAFSLQEFPDSSGGASSSNGEFDESSLLQNSSWQQVAPRVRTYTKVRNGRGSVANSKRLPSTVYPILLLDERIESHVP